MKEAIIPGTILPDGTLHLNQPVPLPPGNVEVVVRAHEVVGTDILETLERIWAESKRRGIVPRSADEIDADIESIRQAAAEEILETGGLGESNPRA